MGDPIDRQADMDFGRELHTTPSKIAGFWKSGRDFFVDFDY